MIQVGYVCIIVGRENVINTVAIKKKTNIGAKLYIHHLSNRCLLVCIWKRFEIDLQSC